MVAGTVVFVIALKYIYDDFESAGKKLRYVIVGTSKITHS